jgi:putative DNA primase/helicase
MTPLREIARNRWPSLLPALGVASSYLTGKHGPCPICKEGKDRWRFDNKDGAGTWFCSNCGAGDGVKLVMLVRGWEFREAAVEIEKLVGTAPLSPSPAKADAEAARRQMNAIWQSARPLVEVREAAEWWAVRVGDVPGLSSVRGVARLRYQDRSGEPSWHPGMVARVQNFGGKPVNLHRTYLGPGGRKAPVATPRKLIRGAELPPGSAVRLMPFTDVLGIAEGIETAVAASKIFSVPCWAALNANNLEAWFPPDGVRVVVFGDNDDSFTGQDSAYALARRLKSKGISVDVQLPPRRGDWNDVLLNEMEAA